MGFASLAQKVIAVAGGAGYIGSAICIGLAQQGAKVAVLDAHEERASAVVDRISGFGGLGLFRRVDVADESEMHATFSDLAINCAPLDGLVNCFAPLSKLLEERPVAEAPLALWDEILRVTLRGALISIRAALPLVDPDRGASIVNVSSIHAIAGDPRLVAYPAAKAGLLALTRSTATQYGHLRVRCNAVCPGAVPHPDTDPSFTAQRIRAQLIARSGTPDDVAHLVTFLMADESRFITGQSIVVDGGTLMHLPLPEDNALDQDHDLNRTSVLPN